MLMDGQGDDDGAQIMPEFEAGWSTTAKVEECLHLLEKRRDVIEGFEADNAALTARIKELEQINADLCRSHGVLNVTGAKLEGQVEALEAKLAAAERRCRSMQTRQNGMTAISSLKTTGQSFVLIHPQLRMIRATKPAQLGAVMSRYPDPTPLIWLSFVGLATLFALAGGALFYLSYHLIRAVLFYVGAL